MQSLKSKIAWCQRIQLLMGGTLFIVIALFYFGPYLPQSARTKQILSQIAQTRHDLDLGQTKAKEIPYVAAQLKELRDRLADFKKLPDNPQWGEFTKEITQVSKQAQIHKLVTTPFGSTRTDQFTTVPVTLKFEGDFVNVFDFLRHVEDMPRLTRISNISIKGEDLKAGTVMVDMQLNIYFSEAP